MIGCTRRVSLHYIIAFSSAVKDAAAFDFIEKTLLIEIEPLKRHVTLVIEPSQSERVSFKKFKRFILFTALSANDRKDKIMCLSAEAIEFIKDVDAKNTFQIVQKV